MVNEMKNISIPNNLPNDGALGAKVTNETKRISITNNLPQDGA